MEKQLIRAHFPAKRPCPNTWVRAAVKTLVQTSEEGIPNNALKRKGPSTDEREEKREYREKSWKTGGRSWSYQLSDGISEGGGSLLVCTGLSKEQPGHFW